MQFELRGSCIALWKQLDTQKRCIGRWVNYAQMRDASFKIECPPLSSGSDNARRGTSRRHPIAPSPALMSATGQNMQSPRHETPGLHSLPSKKPAASGSGTKGVKTGEGPTRLHQSATNKTVQRKSAHENHRSTFENTFRNTL